ncbi:isocitrate lyase/phosphoenolpyruvate mutase family protein [Asanoa sp. NPDC049518]|uniref:isocitrate lyase/phosphoenolpyruvate mutase family protein n=1 Tax=unclassified Asanoa TaxID=2685164 RepID=UPI003429C3B7
MLGDELMIARGRSSRNEGRPPSTEQSRFADLDAEKRRVPVTSRRHVQDETADGETPPAGDATGGRDRPTGNANNPTASGNARTADHAAPADRAAPAASATPADNAGAANNPTASRNARTAANADNPTGSDTAGVARNAPNNPGAANAAARCGTDRAADSTPPAGAAASVGDVEQHQHRSGVDGVDVAPVPRAILRDALTSGGLVVAPGCYDVLGARVLEAAGLEAAYLTPFGFQAADAPSPHAPHDPWERYLDLARELVDASGLAIIVDGQTGLEGNRSAQERAADAFSAGAAGFVIEDRQAFGKDRPLRTMAEVGREIADVRHEVGRETTVIVRTDAVRESVDDARARCESYLDAGADLVFPLMTRYLSYPDTPADRERRMSAYQFLTERVPPKSLVVHSPTGRHLPVDEARRLGFGLYLMSQLLIASAVTGMTHELAAALTDEPGPLPLLTPVDLATLTRVDQWLENRW